MKRWVNDSLAHDDLSNSCGPWCGSPTLSSHILTSLFLPFNIYSQICLHAWTPEESKHLQLFPPLCLVGNLILPHPFPYFTSLLDLTCYWKQQSAASSICCLICLFSKKEWTQTLIHLLITLGLPYLKWGFEEGHTNKVEKSVFF